MRAEIARIQRDLGVTTIYVTHDQIEAMTMGDRVAVMRGGSSAGRRAAGALRPPGESVRRRVHRLARDEPRQRELAADGELWRFGEQRIARAGRGARRRGRPRRTRDARSRSASVRRTSKTPTLGARTPGHAKASRRRHARGHGLGGVRALRARRRAGRARRRWLEATRSEESLEGSTSGRAAAALRRAGSTADHGAREGERDRARRRLEAAALLRPRDRGRDLLAGLSAEGRADEGEQPRAEARRRPGRVEQLGPVPG